MEKATVTLGDFEIMQLILKAFDFECVTDDSCTHKKVYTKGDVYVVVNKCGNNEEDSLR